MQLLAATARRLLSLLLLRSCSNRKQGEGAGPVSYGLGLVLMGILLPACLQRLHTVLQPVQEADSSILTLARRKGLFQQPGLHHRDGESSHHWFSAEPAGGGGLSQTASAGAAGGPRTAGSKQRQQPQEAYFIALNLFNSEEILPQLKREIGRFIDMVGSDNVFVSVFENGERGTGERRGFPRC